MNRRTIVAACAGSMLVSGCAAIDSESLRVSLAGMSLSETSLLEQRYLLRVRLQNPSDRAMHLDGFVYDLTLNGRQFARGVSDQTVVVPRFGEQVIELPAVGTTGGVIRQVLEFGSRRQVDYRLAGRAGEGGGRLRFDGTGDIPIPSQWLDLAR